MSYQGTCMDCQWSQTEMKKTGPARDHAEIHDHTVVAEVTRRFLYEGRGA